MCGRQRHHEVGSPKGEPHRRTSRERRAAGVNGSTEAGGAPSSASQPGPDCRKVVRHRAEEPDLSQLREQEAENGKKPCGLVAQAAGSEVERWSWVHEPSVGCRSRFGASSPSTKESREANQGRFGVARRGSSILSTENEPSPAGERVRGGRRERKRERRQLHSTARESTKTTEGILGVRGCRL